ncbi:50S ribosomal protein L3 [Candidatus Nomurabacteria bacterium]|nr:50S ribosomal protein L3 [Candidatus Nomurabacteria bacterium]
MKFILGTKENMAEYFSEDGAVVPVTIVSAPPVTIKRIFTQEKDGYDSVQVKFGKEKKEKLKEFRLKPADKVDMKEGDAIDVSSFAPGDKITVSSVSKGKGFQGVVKRHGFAGGPRTHGQKHSEREPGSIGGGLRTHVPKGMRMAGRMGSDRITQKNLQVVLVDKENNLMLVKGAVAGRRGTLVEVVAR